MHWDARSDLGGTETNDFRAVQGAEVLRTLFLTEGEIYGSSYLVKNYLPKLGKRSNNFFYSPVKLTLLELPKPSKIGLIVVHIA